MNRILVPFLVVIPVLQKPVMMHSRLLKTIRGRRHLVVLTVLMNGTGVTVGRNSNQRVPLFRLLILVKVPPRPVRVSLLVSSFSSSSRL